LEAMDVNDDNWFLPAPAIAPVNWFLL
jgi:hypothetical protein